MKTIEGDILDIEEGLICHQVNTCGVFNAGLAKQIRIKYPIVFECYSKRYKSNLWTLGDVQAVKVTHTLTVANIAAQATYGRSGLHTNYDALNQGFKKIADKFKGQIYIPEKIGCGLAGGDWEVVFDMIEKELPQVIIVRKIG